MRNRFLGKKHEDNTFDNDMCQCLQFSEMKSRQRIILTCYIQLES